MPMKHFWEKGLTLQEIPLKFFEATPLFYEDFLSRKSLMTRLEQSNFSLAVVDVTFSNMGLVFSHHLGTAHTNVCKSSFLLSMQLVRNSILLSSLT